MPTAVENHPKVYLETFGCQANALESIHLTRLLREASFEMTDDLADADAVLFNTCAVRDHAEHKILSRLGRLEDWKGERPGRVLGVLGCMAVEHKERLLERVPHLDLVLGPDQYPKVAEALRRAAQGSPSVWTEFDPVYFPENDPARLASPFRAFVGILKGCNNFCTYCVVPSTRGREVSRNPDAVVEEVRRLVDAGIVEVTLLGQNVNSYDGGAGTGFPELLRRVGAVPGLRRLRFMTPHPKDLSEGLVRAFAEIPNLCPSLHLPVQSGSDSVLRRMNRRYTAAHYLGLVDSLRKARRDLSFSTDFIVGFPGETDGEFEETLRLMDAVRFDLYYSFKFSPRPGTRAADLEGQVGEDVKEERHARLKAKANEHSLERARARVGLVEQVLVDGEAERTPGALYGKSLQNRVVVFPSSGHRPGELVDVRIEECRVANLLGKVVE